MLEDVVGAHNLALHVFHIPLRDQSATTEIIAFENLLEHHLRTQKGIVLVILAFKEV